MGEDKENLILESNCNLSEDPAVAGSQYDQKIFRMELGACSSSVGAYRTRPKIRNSQIRNRSSGFERFLSVHGKPLLAAVLTMISSTASLIFFPIFLETLTDKNEFRFSDGYSAGFVLTTSSTALFLLVAMFLQITQWFTNRRPRNSKFIPAQISWLNILKIGVSTALSLLTVCFAWEDHKVLCNMQLPLLGFVFVFASITHALSRWKELGFRRSFAILGVIGGIFISVDFSVVDIEQCRGIHPPPKDRWTWKVHLVWTLAFVVAIWLWTIAIFSMESLIPLSEAHHRRRRKTEEVGVRMTVLKGKSFGVSRKQSSPAVPVEQDVEPGEISNGAIYLRVPLRSISTALLFLHLTTWSVVLSLFWTEFIPGFGKGVHSDDFSLLSMLENGFLLSFTSGPFWVILMSECLFAHAFAYLLISIRSPLIAIGVMCFGFPTVALWWSLFQIRSPSPFLVWMPMVTEVMAAVLGFPLIIGGTIYLFFLDVLGRSKVLNGQEK